MQRRRNKGRESGHKKMIKKNETRKRDRLLRKASEAIKVITSGKLDYKNVESMCHNFTLMR